MTWPTAICASSYRINDGYPHLSLMYPLWVPIRKTRGHMNPMKIAIVDELWTQTRNNPGCWWFNLRSQIPPFNDLTTATSTGRTCPVARSGAWARHRGSGWISCWDSGLYFRPRFYRFNQFQSVSISFNQFQSVSISFNQFQSVSISFNQFQSVSISFNRFQSVSIGFNQFQSVSISFTQVVLLKVAFQGCFPTISFPCSVFFCFPTSPGISVSRAPSYFVPWVVSKSWCPASARRPCGKDWLFWRRLKSGAA